MRPYGRDSVGSSPFTVTGSNRFRGPAGFEVTARENPNKLRVATDRPHKSARRSHTKPRAERPTLSSQQHAKREAHIDRRADSPYAAMRMGRSWVTSLQYPVPTVFGEPRGPRCPHSNTQNERPTLSSQQHAKREAAVAIPLPLRLTWKADRSRRGKTLALPKIDDKQKKMRAILWTRKRRRHRKIRTIGTLLTTGGSESAPAR